MSGFHCLFSTGGLLGAVLVSVLLEFKFELLFCALTIASIMALIFIFQWKYLLNVIEDRPQIQIQSPTEKRFVFPDATVLLLGVMCFIAFMAEGAMLDWSAEFLRSALHYEAALAGIGYALFSIAMAGGRLTGDRLIQRFGSLAVFQVGSLVAAGGFLVVVTSSWGYGELLGFCLIGIGAANIVPILFSTSGRLPATSPSYALSVVTTVGYLGMLIGPACIGFIAQATSLSLALGGIALLLAAVGLKGGGVLLASPAISQYAVMPSIEGEGERPLLTSEGI